jgi:hypothetical protein
MMSSTSIRERRNSVVPRLMRDLTNYSTNNPAGESRRKRHIVCSTFWHLHDFLQIRSRFGRVAF